MPILHTTHAQPVEVDLFTSFWLAAHWVWSRRQLAKQAGFPFSEETITETILLDLATHNPLEIQVLPLNKQQEGRVGADWEWCFYNQQQDRFLQTLVQAKVLDNLDSEYSHIDRKIGNTGIRQIDRLLETARRRNVSALYVFYNHLSDETRLPAGACPCIQCTECWGCSVAYAPGVAAALPDKSFDTLRMISKPWACLLCPIIPEMEPDTVSAPDRVADMLRLLVQESRRTDTARVVDIPMPEDASLIRRSPPPYFFQVRFLGRTESEKERDSMAKTLAAENPGVDGIVLITDRKEERG